MERGASPSPSPSSSSGADRAFRVLDAFTHTDPGSIVTALAIDDAGGRVFIGTSDGAVEEHSLKPGAPSSLLARRHVGATRKPIASLAHLPAARALAALADGVLLLVDEETLGSVPVAGLATVTAIAAGGDASARLAAIARLPRRRSRATALAVVPGTGAVRVGASGGGGATAAVVTHDTPFADPAPTTAAAWVGASAVVLASAHRYGLWTPSSGSVTTLIAFPSDAPAAWPLAVSVSLPVSPTTATFRPGALLLIDQAGAVVGADGAPAGPGLSFCPSSGPPSALAAAGGHFVIAAGGAGLEVHDLATGGRVAALPYPGGARPAPGQRLLAASAGGGAGLAIVSGARKAWALVPVSPAERAAAALAAGDPATALAAVDERGGSAAGAWAGAARAEAGLALAARGDWAAATPALAACEPGLDFHPAELWPACPAVVAAVCGSGGAAAAGEAAAGAARVARRTALGLEADAPPPPFTGPPDTEAAMDALASALLRCQGRGGGDVDDGALAAALLAVLSTSATTDDRGRLAALAPALTPPSLRTADTALDTSGRHAALANLRAAAGDAAGALAVWRALAHGERLEGGGGTDASAAASAAAALLADTAACPDPATVATHAPWVLRWQGVVSGGGGDGGGDDDGDGADDDGRPPPSAIAALAARAPGLPPSTALSLLPTARSKRQYLEAVVFGRQDGGGGGDAATRAADAPTRTALALALARRAAALEAAGSPSLPAARASLARLLGSPACASLLDAPALGAVLERTRLWPERAAVLEAGGDAPGAVRLLALAARDVVAARAVGVRAAGGRADAVAAADAALLELLLHPPAGDGAAPTDAAAAAAASPLLTEAATLLTIPGVDLDPVSILDAMPDTTPLPLAAPVLARLLAARTHRRRCGALARGLARAAHAGAAADRADALSASVRFPAAGRACKACRARIGVGRVFAVVSGDGGVACAKCAGVGGGGGA